jgi:hypothetical protein
MNPLIEFAMPLEMRIRKNYAAAIEDMTNDNGTRNESKWGFFCDQDQLYYLAEDMVPGLEKVYNDDAQEHHNGYTDWLNALFSVECAVLEFDGTV